MMRNAIRWTTLLAVFSCLPNLAAAQTIAASNVPALTSFSGILTGFDGKPLTGMVGITLSLYKDQQGGAPLWLENQSVKADRSGRLLLLVGVACHWNV